MDTAVTGKGRRIGGGLYADLVTPFDGDGRLDTGAFRAIVEYAAAAGVDGIVAAGPSGEAGS
ncbi:MAG: dihydrodipicolinate synthase family protein, partial [Planctomycetota bacterium]|nr:dihydrodipicolinate synthase family protein [Planctomycetota bacterium]